MHKPKFYLVMGLVTLLAIIFTACKAEAPTPSITPVPIPSPTSAPAPAPETGLENPVIIKDMNGQKWDVTHARDTYDMNPAYYNYGIGVGSIPSVDFPKVLEEGDTGYPDSGDMRRVFGVNHNGEQRAYSVTQLYGHEVINDIYPGESDQYVAVTY